MIERDMEDLIAEYPADFFPRLGLILKGRQKSFAGVGRFDLLFEDCHGTQALMELKARAAKYEDADQLARYKDELERLGTDNVLMWLVASLIPNAVRQFLDRVGIEYSEIHEAEFRRVAARHGTTIRSEAVAPDVTTVTAASGPMRPSMTLRSPLSQAATIVRRTFSGTQVLTGATVEKPSKFRWIAYGFELAIENPDAFDSNHFGRLLDAFEQAVPSRRNASVVGSLRTWAVNPRFSRLPQGTYCSLLRWVTTSGWKAAVPHAEAIWSYLFGKPTPTWYVWDLGRKAYQFDAAAWKVWLESLSAAGRNAEKV